MKKKKLAMVLSRLDRPEKSSPTLEQYPTEGELASEMIYTAFEFGDVEGKRVADLGCGNGVLGLACSMLGAEEVFLLDIDESALRVASRNARRIEKSLKGRLFFFNCKIEDFSLRCDTVIMNPPFGTRKRHADRLFLMKAFQIAPVVYSLHKKGNIAYLAGLDERFRITNVWEKRMRIDRMFEFHEKRSIEVKVEYVRFTRVI